MRGAQQDGAIQGNPAALLVLQVQVRDQAVVDRLVQESSTGGQAIGLDVNAQAGRRAKNV